MTRIERTVRRKENTKVNRVMAKGRGEERRRVRKERNEMQVKRKMTWSSNGLQGEE